jgi:hypothetical protein
MHQWKTSNAEYRVDNDGLRELEAGAWERVDPGRFAWELIDEIEHLAEALADERERCARVCEAEAVGVLEIVAFALRRAAARIRKG